MVRLFIQCKFYPQTYLFLQVKTSYIADIKMGEGILQIFRWGMEYYYFIKYVFRWGWNIIILLDMYTNMTYYVTF